MSKFSKEEEAVITKMVEDIMEEEFDTLAELEDDCGGDTCGCCGCEIDSQWLIQLDVKDYAVIQEDEDCGGYLISLSPIPDKPGIFKEGRVISLTNIVEEDIHISKLPVKIERVSFDSWSVIAGV